ncbi:S8 family serine peptidase [Actinokineospora sp. UTMC 2448]|uniref:S8 family serine peptidase n=1 Tax=Actinokineospora sp. UTMC 2448 TaxID=2268449 RepID=UPI00220A7027|nr:S8 family serine peptidase [Actinokineospora sp. UTMC 2448]UVS79704.1 Intracellular serine protease [Actinokineospora sp. UTMC 2448]
MRTALVVAFLALWLAPPKASALTDCAPAAHDPAPHRSWAQDRLSPERAWPLTTGGGVVAVISTGVSATAPALAGAVLPGTDLAGGRGDQDCSGHGTFLAGLVAARPTDPTDHPESAETAEPASHSGATDHSGPTTDTDPTTQPEPTATSAANSEPTAHAEPAAFPGPAANPDPSARSEPATHSGPGTHSGAADLPSAALSTLTAHSKPIALSESVAHSGTVDHIESTTPFGPVVHSRAADDTEPANYFQAAVHTGPVVRARPAGAGGKPGVVHAARSNPVAAVRLAFAALNVRAVMAESSARVGTSPGAGVAPGVRILPVRVADEPGEVSPERLAAGIVAAVEGGASVIAVGVVATRDSAGLRAAVELARQRDVLVVASARVREDGEVAFPAALPGVLSVAPIGPDGPVAGVRLGARPDLAAPAVDLIGIAPSGAGHRVASGAELAVGPVAGAAALVRDYHRDLTAPQVAARLVATADRPVAGVGVVDPVAAVTTILTDATPPPLAEERLTIPKPAEPDTGPLHRALWFAAVAVVVAVPLAAVRRRE